MNWKSALFAVFLIALLLPCVSADLGPKSTANFLIDYAGTESVESFSDETFHARLLSCYLQGVDYPDMQIPEFAEKFAHFDGERNCTWASNRLIWGRDWFYGSVFADDSEDLGFSYQIPDEFKLAIYSEYNDRLFLSDVIEKKSYYSNYSATLNENGSIQVTETTSFNETGGGQYLLQFALAFIITLIIELILTALLRKAFKAPKSIIALAAIANMITLPIVWFVFPLLQIALLVFVLSELFAVLFEGLFFYFGTKKQISLQNAFILSLINNVASLMVGGFFLGVLIVMQTVRMI